MILRQNRRTGAAALEAAIVFPLMVLLVLGIMIGASGVYAYQEVCYLAREGSRYAMVRGTTYAKETGNSAATAADVYNNAILPAVTMLDTTLLSYSVTWNSSNTPFVTTTSTSTPVGNTVTVTVSYTWWPEKYIGGPLTLSSSSTMQMAY